MDHAPRDADRVIDLRAVSFERDGRPILDDITWSVAPREHWIVLGRNGSGKSTLVQIAAMHLHPSRGEVVILGETLGRTDVRLLRRRIGMSGARLADALRPGLTARDAVMTARFAALEPWWHSYTEDDRRRAHELLERFGVGSHSSQPLGTLSSGERQRVLLARALMNDPDLLLLDEPTAGLDIAGREELVSALSLLAHDSTSPPIVLVTHHLEEIPPGFTHALLVRDGRVTAHGPVADVLTDGLLGECFGIALAVSQADGRWYARATGGP